MTQRGVRLHSLDDKRTVRCELPFRFDSTTRVRYRTASGSDRMPPFNFGYLFFFIRVKLSVASGRYRSRFRKRGALFAGIVRLTNFVTNGSTLPFLTSAAMDMD